MKAVTYCVLVASFLLVLEGCSSQKNYVRRPVIVEEKDREHIPQPEFRRVSLFEDAVENIFGREVDEYGDLTWHVQRLSNNYEQAKNLNALDEAPNSSWFTNRHHQQRMSPAELQRGPNQGSGPDLSGPVTVLGAKLEGASPGFRMRDASGDIYFVKFDNKGYPQLNTAAEIITAKFVYACGYNTPENYLVEIDPAQIQIGQGVTVRDKWGKDVPMTMSYIEQILDRAEPNPDGTYRAVASKKLEGRALGPFSYIGVRADDPNDVVPHDHRRELRGYKVISAWLNNSDSKANNTLDTYVTENGKGYVKHHLIDFATSLGSSGYGSAPPSRGKAGAFDLAHILKKVLTLGLYVEPHEKKPALISPSVGYFDSDLFDPGSYAFIVPNPAFQRMTELDAFWGAKIVMSFSDEDIRTIVATGEYANPEDAEYVAKTLIERRDKTGRYWYAKVNSLDNFRLSNTNHGELSVGFDDLAVVAGFETDESTEYRYRLLYRGSAMTGYAFARGKQVLAMNREMRAVVDSLFSQLKPKTDSDKIVTFEIETRRLPQSKWSKRVWLYVYYPWQAGDSAEIIALRREN